LIEVFILEIIKFKYKVGQKLCLREGSTDKKIKNWFNAGVTCAGMGSKLITKDIIEMMVFKNLKNKVKSTLPLVQQIRNY